jgi:hypothetical protein
LEQGKAPLGLVTAFIAKRWETNYSENLRGNRKYNMVLFFSG